ncbi:MAG: hypothetical protein IJK89_12290 [Clostridia bacterium]|nr:hypothetical protein [Clostridia bacterium]
MRHVAIITSRPKRSGSSSIPDGAITGNGDLAVILGNSPEGLRVFLSKTDVWFAVEQESEGGLRPVGYIDIPVPRGMYRNYRVEQDMDLGLLRCGFSHGKKALRIAIRVAAEENAVLIEADGDAEIDPVLYAYDLGETTGRGGVFNEKGVSGVFRSFDGENCLYETHVFAAGRKLTGGRYYAFIATNHDCEDPKREAVEKVAGITPDRFGALTASHAAFWRDFWSRSRFTVSDPELETRWYASQYFLAVCARNGKYPPGLYANFVTVERPNWHSDYHLNYNYQAPFYAACSSNHTELTDCYLSPLEEFVPRGRTFAEKLGCGGILFPCGIAPGGYMTEAAPGAKYEFERPFMGQKNDALHAADIAVFRWNATRNVDYAREHAYPYLKECLAFFTDYAVLEDGVYAIPDDSVHEAPYYRDDFDEETYPYIHDKNNVLTLGLLRLCIPAAIDMAQTLGIDEDRCAAWRDFLKKLPDFPTFIRKGQEVYRYTEKGQAWHPDNDVGQQHIFPCGCVGLSSSERELRLARNTVGQRLFGFKDCNAVSSFYAIGARIGWDPAYMIDRLREFNAETGMANLLHDMPGGCLEYCVVNALALNEMALQSHQGTVRIFPDWDVRLDCAYERLRADGAFLVSAEMKNGKAVKAEIVSEKGGLLRVAFPAETISVSVNGVPVGLSAEALEGGIATAPGDTVTITAIR